MTAQDHVDDELLYIRWVLADGPAKAEAEHEALARAGLDTLSAAGWRVLGAELVRPAFHEFGLIEAVLRKGDRVALIQWNTFNRGWMIKGPHGSTIFEG